MSKAEVSSYTFSKTDYIIKPTATHTSTVIFMHGLGDTPKGGWSHEFDMISKSKSFSHIKFILPCAPVQSVTLNGGMKMTAWHDIQSLTKLLDNNFKGKQESLKMINAIIDNEINNQHIPSERILLAGFSQGGAMSIYVGLQYSKKLAGIISLSGYVCDFKMKELIHKENLTTPVFLFHAKNDNIVQRQFGEKSSDYLKEAGCNVTWKTFDIDYHGCSEEEMRDMMLQIGNLLPAKTKEKTEKTNDKEKPDGKSGE